MTDLVANWHIITVASALRYSRQRAFPAGCYRVAFPRCETQETDSDKQNGKDFHLALLLGNAVAAVVTAMVETTRNSQPASHVASACAEPTAHAAKMAPTKTSTHAPDVTSTEASSMASTKTSAMSATPAAVSPTTTTTAATTGLCISYRQAACEHRRHQNRHHPLQHRIFPRRRRLGRRMFRPISKCR
jgi:hypothetical protein